MDKKKASFRVNPDMLRLLILLTIAILFFGFSKNWAIFKPKMIANMLMQMPEYGIIALGIMITRISARIDLSVVGTANLSAIIAALYMKNSVSDDVAGFPAVWAMFIVLVLALVVGLLCGLLNAFLIHNLELPSFVATIGTGTLYSGIGVILTKGTTISKLPRVFYKTLTLKVGIIPISLMLYVLCALFLGFLLYKTKFGLRLYLSGANSKASRFAGINESAIVYKSYMISAVMSVLGGLIMMARFNSVNASNGVTYSLMGILICMIGGINPSGGSGRVEGVVIATFIMQLISSGMSLFHNINSYYNKLVYGGLLIIFMVFNFYINRSRERRLNAKRN